VIDLDIGFSSIVSRSAITPAAHTPLQQSTATSRPVEQKNPRVISVCIHYIVNSERRQQLFTDIYTAR